MAAIKKDIKVVYKILKTPSLISIALFGLFALASYSMTQKGESGFRIGFPYKFYEQQKVSIDNVNSATWHPINLILDCILLWTVSVGMYFLWILKFYKPNKSGEAQQVT